MSSKLKDEVTDQDSFFDFNRRYFEVPTLVLTGIHLRVFSMMGDRIAIAVLKNTYPPRELDDLRLKKILVAISESFRYPETIQHPSDRIPAVTMCLVEALMSRAASPQQRQMIQSVMDEVRTLPGSST